MSEVDETLRRLQNHKGVLGVVIVNNEGLAIRSTLEATLTHEYADLITSLIKQARSMVTQLDDQNDLTFMRIRTKKHEVMIAPDKNYLMIVIQNPSENV